MLLDKKFYFICSIGEDCTCANYLRQFNLYFRTYPFAWNGRMLLRRRIDFICNDFENFLNKEDLLLIDNNQNENPDILNDYYCDSRTGLSYAHDFAIGKPLDSIFDAVREKYQRRCRRFYRGINDSNRILFVWWSRENHTSKDELLEHYARLQDKFQSKDINLLILESMDIKGFEYEEVHQQILRVSYKVASDLDIAMGSENPNLCVFSKIKFNFSFKKRLCICLKNFLRARYDALPFPKKMESLRIWLKAKLLHAKL